MDGLDDWKNVQIKKIQFLFITCSVCPTVEECAFTELPVLVMFSYTHIMLLLLHYIYLTGTNRYSHLDCNYETESFFLLNDPKMDRK